MKLNMWVIFDWFAKLGYEASEAITDGEAIIEYYNDSRESSVGGVSICPRGKDGGVKIECGSDSVVVQGVSLTSAISAFCQALDKYNKWEASSLLSLIKDRNPQSLVNIAADVFNRPICIKNSEEIIFGVSDDFEYASAQLRARPRLSKSEYDYSGLSATRSAGEAASQEPSVMVSPMYNSVVLQSNLMKNGRSVGKLILLEGGRPFTRGDISLMRKMVEFLNLCIAYDRSDLFSGSGVSTIIVDLIRGKGASATNIDAVYDAKRWSRDDEFMLICFDDCSTGETLLKNSVRSHFNQSFPHSQPVFYEDVLGLINITKAGSYHAVMNRLKLIQPLREMTWSASYNFRGLQHLNIYYHQAGIALEHAKRSALPYASAYDFALKHLMHSIYTNSDCLPMMHPDALKLREIDKNEKTSYAATLQEYLMSGGNYSNVAQRLSIHRNTVIYRIGKINELIMTDLNDYMNQKLLLVSLLITENEQ